MDPNETLRLLRLAIRQARQSDTDRMVTVAESLETVTELAEALDEWLTRGGFLPSDWESAERGPFTVPTTGLEAHPLPGSAVAEHSRSCAIFTGGHDAQGVFRPVACDCRSNR